MEPNEVTSGERASFGTRFIAALIDVVLLNLAGLVLGRLGLPVFGIVIGLAYYTYFEGGETGQTLGKKVMNIRVVDFVTGGPIGYGRAAIRWVGRIVSGLVLFLGYLWMLWDPEKQTWHDKLSASVVVTV